MDFVTVKNGAIELNVAVIGSGPLIVCVHGFPELWYSWRHQMVHFAARGFRVAALDVRGYGRSSKPKEISAYALRQLASDVVAVINHVGDGPAVLFGHDWGAPIVWHTACFIPQDQGGGRSQRAVPSARTRGFHRTGPIHLQGALFLSDLLSARGRRGGGTGSGHRGCLAQDVFRAVRRGAPQQVARAETAGGKTAGWAYRSAALSGLDDE